MCGIGKRLYDDTMPECKNKQTFHIRRGFRITLRSRVVFSVWASHCVTVAPPLLSKAAIGVPTILLLPMTTAV